MTSSLTARDDGRTVRWAGEELAAGTNFMVAVIGRVASSNYNIRCEYQVIDILWNNHTRVCGDQGSAGDIVGSVSLTDQEQGCDDGNGDDASGEHCDSSIE